jgi:hypothetical protein
MSAEGVLANPAIFAGRRPGMRCLPPARWWRFDHSRPPARTEGDDHGAFLLGLALEYLGLAAAHPPPNPRPIQAATRRERGAQR